MNRPVFEDAFFRSVLFRGCPVQSLLYGRCRPGAGHRPAETADSSCLRYGPGNALHASFRRADACSRVRLRQRQTRGYCPVRKPEDQQPARVPMRYPLPRREADVRSAAIFGRFFGQASCQPVREYGIIIHRKPPVSIPDQPLPARPPNGSEPNRTR